MRKIILLIIMILCLYKNSFSATITTTAFVTPDDVTVTNLESNRQKMTDAINSADGGLIQSGTITYSALDADANPHNRWNEAFNDFVYTGLTIPTSASLTSTTASGTAYINGFRVVKDATSKLYTASRWTYVDLSDSGVYTYQATAISAAEPSVSSNSIRLARVSTDSTIVLSVRDDRVTEINIAAGSAGSIADTDADTKIQTEESADEDILRFDLGNATLSSAREVMTLQAVSSTREKLEPTTDEELDLGSSSKKFGTAYTDTIQTDVLKVGTTNQGDIFYDNATSIVRLTPGTSGQVLKTSGASANPSWVNALSSVSDYGTSASSSTARQSTDVKVAFGELSVSGSSNASLSNLPFTSSTSFTIVCSFANTTTAIEACVAKPSSGSAATLYNNDDQVQTLNWIAIGI